MKAIVERMMGIAREPSLDAIKGSERVILLGLLTVADVLADGLDRIDGRYQKSIALMEALAKRNGVAP